MHTHSLYIIPQQEWLFKKYYIRLGGAGFESGGGEEKEEEEQEDNAKVRGGKGWIYHDTEQLNNITPTNSLTRIYIYIMTRVV